MIVRERAVRVVLVFAQPDIDNRSTIHRQLETIPPQHATSVTPAVPVERARLIIRLGAFTTPRTCRDGIRISKPRIRQIEVGVVHPT